MAALTYDRAQRVPQAAARKAEEIGSPSGIAVLDGGRELMAFGRQTGALLASTDISTSRAYTARSMGTNTGDLMPLVQPGGPLFGLERTQARPSVPFVPFGGGRPLPAGGEIVGALGVAEGAVEQDEEIAAAGAEALPRAQKEDKEHATRR